MNILLGGTVKTNSVNEFDYSIKYLSNEEIKEKLLETCIELEETTEELEVKQEELEEMENRKEIEIEELGDEKEKFREERDFLIDFLEDIGVNKKGLIEYFDRSTYSIFEAEEKKKELIEFIKAKLFLH